MFLVQVSRLPALKINYVPPDASTMAAALAESLGVQMEEFEKKLEKEREVIRAQYKAELDRYRKESEEKAAELKRCALA